MENSFQTSFIPKKQTVSGYSKIGHQSLFYFLAIFLLVVVILASGGLFFYKNYLTKQKNGLSESLSASRESFEEETIEELNLFNRRTDAVKQILSNHVALTPVFSLLEEITVPTIQFKSFNQQVLGKESSVKIEGVAKDYRAIVLQSEVFSGEKGNAFKNVIFSDLEKDKNGHVNFNLSFNVDPNLFSYEKSNLLENSVE